VDISVVVCTHNPRPDYLRRTLDSLAAQTLPRDAWELLIVDNASEPSVADAWDISWHPRGRHLREPRLGLIWARLSGIAETRGDLLVFVDDDNVLAPAYLEQALSIARQWPKLGVFGSGRLEPEFETEPPLRLRTQLYRLALRAASSPRWGNNPEDADSVPWGAGLCVDRRIASAYPQRVRDLGLGDVLGRRGLELCAGEDDLFSWVSAATGFGCGVFPELRVTHLIPAHRLRDEYVFRLAQDNAFSHGVLRYRATGRQPRRMGWERRVRLLLYGLRRGFFAMRCEWAVSRGEERAARYVAEHRLAPGPMLAPGGPVSVC
jgi:glycosyltransferase involved in cell wall biosynthesis